MHRCCPSGKEGVGRYGTGCACLKSGLGAPSLSGQGSPLPSSCHFLPVYHMHFRSPLMFSEMQEVAPFASGAPPTALCSSDGKATKKQAMPESLGSILKGQEPFRALRSTFSLGCAFPLSTASTTTEFSWKSMGTPGMQNPGPAEPGATATSVHSTLHCLRIYVSIPVNNVEELSVGAELLMVTVKLFYLQKPETAYSLSGAFRLPLRLKHFC